MSRRHRAALVAIAAISVAAICALLFGPARGARDDIAHVRTDLHSSRQGIYGVLQRTTQQLRAAEQSLEIQRQGLSIAHSSQQLARATSHNTADLLDQTTSTLALVRRVVTQLGPLQQLGADVHAALSSVEAGVAIARSALAVAQQTLTTGRQALAVAVTTLQTLQHSEQIQQQLLDVARQTLEQTQQINRRLALLPVLPAPTATGGS